jgi:hypothetical protein
MSQQQRPDAAVLLAAAVRAADTWDSYASLGGDEELREHELAIDSLSRLLNGTRRMQRLDADHDGIVRLRCECGWRGSPRTKRDGPRTIHAQDATEFAAHTCLPNLVHSVTVRPDGAVEIPLYGKKAAGRVALVDQADANLVLRNRWHVYEVRRSGRTHGPYASAFNRGIGGIVSMHKLITGWPLTDHLNHDGLDNRRQNLRPATTSQNRQNQRPPIGGSSRFKGVSWHKRSRKWVAQMGGEQHYLGSFASEEDAARAYDCAARQAYGEFAYLNFPDEVIIVPPTRSVKSAVRQQRGFEHANGVRYQIIRVGRSWIAEAECDCTIGPHWHERGRALTRRDLTALIRKAS